MKITIFFLALWAGLQTVNAAEMAPAVFMDRLSERLTGSWPLPAEFTRLKDEMKRTGCKTVTCLDGFFRQYIQEKMQTPQFYVHAVLKVYERFGYRAPVRLMVDERYTSIETDEMRSVQDLMLIDRVFRQNLSFDELYTSQLVATRAGSQDNRYAFLTDLRIDAGDLVVPSTTSELPLLPTIGEDGRIISRGQGLPLKVADYSGHPNVSGLFTTKKFQERYWNSPENQNRKRAAAFFKIMLCDSLSPSLEREGQMARERRLALGRSDEQVTREEIEDIHRNRHAHQKDCSLCHQRLDPVARTFRPMELGIGRFSNPGSLRYFSSLNEMQDIKVKNFHDLVVQATHQAPYLDCQMNWLVDTFLGHDLQLHPQRFADLTKDAEGAQRRVKTVIMQLLMAPEFRGLPSTVVEPPSFVQAKKVFEGCAECHGSFFKARTDQIKTKLSRISVCMDLPHDGKDRAMPPTSHWWEPNAQQVQTVKSWILQGAPLAEGSPLFSAEETNKLFSPELKVKKCRE